MGPEGLHWYHRQWVDIKSILIFLLGIAKCRDEQAVIKGSGVEIKVHDIFYTYNYLYLSRLRD